MFGSGCCQCVLQFWTCLAVRKPRGTNKMLEGLKFPSGLEVPQCPPEDQEEEARERMIRLPWRDLRDAHFIQLISIVPCQVDAFQESLRQKSPGTIYQLVMALWSTQAGKLQLQTGTVNTKIKPFSLCPWKRGLVFLFQTLERLTGTKRCCDSYFDSAYLCFQEELKFGFSCQ